MMIDNDFPVQFGGKNNAIGFLQQYASGMQDYSQEQGGPLISRTIRYSPPNAIIKTPHLDSPYMDELIRRDFKPLKPPGPKGPQLPSFL